MEREVIHSVYPSTREEKPECSTLKTHLQSKVDIHRLVGLLQFFAFEGHNDVIRIHRTWRLLQLVAGATKGGNRAKLWTSKAWQSLTREEKSSWETRFGSLAYQPTTITNRLQEFCTRFLSSHSYLDAMVISHKRFDLLAFHHHVLKTIGQVPNETEIPGVSWKSRCALNAIIDTDQCPFPLAVVAFFICNDQVAVSALKEYKQFWEGKLTDRVFKKWDRQFWKNHPAAVYYISTVVKRYARLKNSLVRFMSFKNPKQGACCPCQTTALYCKDCLEIKSIPNFKHPPPGGSIALDVNTDRVVCQLCKSPRIIKIPLFNPSNSDTTLSITHPDRSPLHICNGSTYSFTLTSYNGSCRECVC